MTQIVINLLLVAHVLTSVLLLLIVLMQRPKSEGLGAAFGGGMTENMFGAQTTTVLTKMTVYLGILFFILTLSLAILYAQRTEGISTLEREMRILEETTIPGAVPDPVPAEPAPPEESPATPEIEPVTLDLTGNPPSGSTPEPRISENRTLLPSGEEARQAPAPEAGQ